MKRLLTAALLASQATGADAQQFMDAATVRPILEATKANWVAVREYEGKDLLYFTHLMAWRCGLAGIAFSLNDDPTLYQWPMPPCRIGTAQPAAILDTDAVYATLPIGGVSKVRVILTYDDGQVVDETFDRHQIQLN